MFLALVDKNKYSLKSLRNQFGSVKEVILTSFDDNQNLIVLSDSYLLEKLDIQFTRYYPEKNNPILGEDGTIQIFGFPKSWTEDQIKLFILNLLEILPDTRGFTDSVHLSLKEDYVLLKRIKIMSYHRANFRVILNNYEIDSEYKLSAVWNQDDSAKQKDLELDSFANQVLDASRNEIKKKD